ncbi:MAG: flagellar filament outer layer protein FlaA [Spirochaetales bacterium]|jgi:hypothetical protein|nr:flagellar filament outer layer protein FlaA [Spirochaetales bacterium]
MKKILCVLSIFFLVSVFGFAQDQQADRADSAVPGPGRPQEQSIGVDTAQQKLKEISITKFEDAGFWKASISLDEGITTGRRLEGAPGAKTPIPDEEEIGIANVENDTFVLGVKTEFFHRGAASIAVVPTRPINLAGVVKTLSVWVVGRNYNHILKAVFQDFAGKKFELTIGKLNFSGWKQLIVPIPAEGVTQRDAHYSTLTGIQFLGFRIECDMMETYGSYFIYFDDMRIVTDLFTEEDRDSDDMLDTW